MKILLTLILLSIINCSIPQKKEKYFGDWNLFSQIEINKDTQESIRKKLGKPDEIKMEHVAENEAQWNYFRNGVPKIWIYFKNDVVRSVSMSVWEEEDVQVLTYLLKNFQGQWRVEKEPVTNPHAMPSQCYLIDEKQGREIEIDSYKKSVESILSQDAKLFKKNKSEQKKIKTYKGWDYDHCAWLKDFLKSKGLLVN